MFEKQAREVVKDAGFKSVKPGNLLFQFKHHDGQRLFFVIAVETHYSELFSNLIKIKMIPFDDHGNYDHSRSEFDLNFHTILVLRTDRLSRYGLRKI